jgi:type IV pilus assembly protein PilB
LLQPKQLSLGPVDSPRFSAPPFAPVDHRSSVKWGMGRARLEPLPDPSPDREDGAPGTTLGDEAPEPRGDGPSGQEVADSSSPDAGPSSLDEALSSPGAEFDEDGPATEESEEAPVDPIDELEDQIDTELVDKFASRMSSGMSIETNDRVVEMLMRRGEIEPEQVREAQARRDMVDEPDLALWRVLAEQEDTDAETVYERAARIYAFAVADLDAENRDLDFVQSMVESFGDEQKEQLTELGLVPHHVETTDRGRTVVFITHDPMRREVHTLARSFELDHFELRYAPKSAVNDLLSDAFPKDNKYLDRLDEDSSIDLGQNFEDEEDLIDDEKLEEQINRSTLINLFEATLVEAVREGASDIHIFPNADEEVEIHLRVDGRLDHWHTEDRVHPEALLSVIKDNSMNVDRFESDAAQDGFIQRRVDGTRIRYRVSIMPIASSNQDIDAESVVIRVLDDRKVITDLGKLGLGARALDQFEHAINQPNGMVILTGPTGSGKSTTLVAALHRVIGPEENVLTIEDPVEYVIEGARQVKLSDKLQLKDALRSVLRHDPDTVMVGEMRDKETAELAIKLANTGHLTFSTLHTNDAPSAVSRLYKMNIEPFLIAYAINLVVAQRLIRTLCPTCKQAVRDPDPLKLKHLGFSAERVAQNPIYTASDGANCNRCGGTGYDGRRAIAEALYLTQPIRHMIVEAEGVVDEGAIREHAQQEDGMRSLQASAREAVLNGETSVDEMIRVVPT